MFSVNSSILVSLYSSVVINCFSWLSGIFDMKVMDVDMESEDCGSVASEQPKKKKLKQGILLVIFRLFIYFFIFVSNNLCLQILIVIIQWVFI